MNKNQESKSKKKKYSTLPTHNTVRSINLSFPNGLPTWKSTNVIKKLQEIESSKPETGILRRSGLVGRQILDLVFEYGLKKCFV